MPQSPQPNSPNLQKAVETTIPALAGILLGFVGALFVAAAITDARFVIDPFKVALPYIKAHPEFDMLLPRRYWIMAASVSAGMWFFFSIHFCIRSQLAFYVKNRPEDYPDVVAPGTDQSDLDAFEAHFKKWRQDRIICGIRGLNCYQAGLHFMLLPIVFILPELAVPLAFIIWLVSLLLLRKNWQVAQP